MESNKINREHLRSGFSIASRKRNQSSERKRENIKLNSLKKKSCGNHSKRKPLISVNRLLRASSRSRHSKISLHENESRDSDCYIVEWTCLPRSHQNNIAATTVVTAPLVLENVNLNENDRLHQLTSLGRNPNTCSQTSVIEVRSKSYVNIQNPTNSNQETRCAICLKNLNGKNLSATVCGHVFCTKCITPVVKNQRHCPICRKRLNLSKIHPLYI